MTLRGPGGQRQVSRTRVLLCSLDGVRPDAIQAANTPTIDRLVNEGAFTWRARTVMPSVTLPCHTSTRRSSKASWINARSWV